MSTAKDMDERAGDSSAGRPCLRHLRQTRLLLGGWLEASEYEGDVAQMLSDEATGVLVMVGVIVGGTAVQVLALGRYEDWQLVVTVAAAFAARILWFLWRRRRAAAWLDEHGHGSS